MPIYRKHPIRVELEPGEPIPPPASAFQIPEPYSYEYSLDRALEHFKEAELRIVTFIQHEPGTTIMEENPKGEHAQWYRVLRQPDPQMIFPIMDCIHWLRQSLDHLAYRLAIIVSGSEPPPNNATTGFPITDRQVQFDSGLTNYIGPKKQMSPAMFALLQGAQPYKGGNAQLLAVLRDLDNFAKHRFPPVITVGGMVSDFKIDSLEGTWIKPPVSGPIEDGAEIMRFIPVAGTYMKMSFRFVNSVAFAKGHPGHGHEVLPLLQGIREYLWMGLIPSFEALPEFP